MSARSNISAKSNVSQMLTNSEEQRDHKGNWHDNFVNALKKRVKDAESIEREMKSLKNSVTAKEMKIKILEKNQGIDKN